MEMITNNQELEINYKWGNGAWTYYLVIPGTAQLVSKWGLLKVSGTIDGVEVKSINLAPRKSADRIISINKEIRDALGKTTGDKVVVTLFLHI